MWVRACRRHADIEQVFTHPLDRDIAPRKCVYRQRDCFQEGAGFDEVCEARQYDFWGDKVCLSRKECECLEPGPGFRGIMETFVIYIDMTAERYGQVFKVGEVEKRLEGGCGNVI